MTEEQTTTPETETSIPAPAPRVSNPGLRRALQFGTVWIHRAEVLSEPSEVRRADMPGANGRRSRTAMGNRKGRRPRAVGRALQRFLSTNDGLMHRLRLRAAQG